MCLDAATTCHGCDIASSAVHVQEERPANEPGHGIPNNDEQHSAYAGSLVQMIGQLHLTWIFATIALKGLDASVAEGQTGLQQMHLGELNYSISSLVFYADGMHSLNRCCMGLMKLWTALV